MAIVALLISIAVPRYMGTLDRSKETTLRQTLAVTRDAIDKFYNDTGKYPDDLTTLVTRRYLRSLPVDPITGSNSTWTTVAGEDPEKGRVHDIRSGAEGTSRDGVAFRNW
jgi:general secretion pathway protein G